MCHMLKTVHEACLVCSIGFCVLTDGSNELVEAAEGEQRLWELPQEKLQSSSDHMDLLPLSVLQVQLLLCRDNRDIMKRKRMKKLQFIDTNTLLQPLSGLQHSVLTSNT